MGLLDFTKSASAVIIQVRFDLLEIKVWFAQHADSFDHSTPFHIPQFDLLAMLHFSVIGNGCFIRFNQFIDSVRDAIIIGDQFFWIFVHVSYSLMSVPQAFIAAINSHNDD